MKVLIVGPAHPLRGGGLATFNERLATEFQQKGDTVDILTFSLQYPSFLFPGTTQLSSEPKPENLNIFVDLNSINPLNWIITGLKFRKKNYDLVVFRFWIPFMGPCLGTVSRILKRKTTKIIAITDNVYPHEKRLGDRFLISYFIKSCDGFITMSKAVFEDLNDFEPLKPKKYVLHPLYDNFGTIIPKSEALKKLNLSPDYNYLLFFGFIRHYKGLDIAIKALADKKLSNLPLKLIIAGEFYEDSKPYLDLIDELNLAERIIKETHFIPNNEVATYFCASDLVVQPYRDATQSGVSQVAYHFNKPMVVTNVGGLAETIPHGKVGYVVSPNSEEIANAISDFFENKKADEMIKNISLEKIKFSWSSLVDNIKEL
jgi:D-inositol-3-phosphate glycosyltransferase